MGGSICVLLVGARLRQPGRARTGSRRKSACNRGPGVPAARRDTLAEEGSHAAVVYKGLAGNVPLQCQLSEGRTRAPSLSELSPLEPAKAFQR